MTLHTICHRPIDSSPVIVRWRHDSPVAGRYETSTGVVLIQHGDLVGGVSEGVEVVLVDTGAVRTLLLPGRGMSIWKIWADEKEFGWTSPVSGPVHPALVPVTDPSGLGWLEGFDELVVRCGLESNGAPEFNADKGLAYSLHGRIANTPAQNLRVVVNEQTDSVEVIGDVIESKLFFKRLRLCARIGFHASLPTVSIVDEVTNDRATSATMQLLYHINVGEPVLSNGSKLFFNFGDLAPKDSLSAGEINTWNDGGPPSSGYAERVYFTTPAASDSHWATAVLASGDQATGLCVRFDTRTLPYFIVWKNFAATQDGYVMGLEPATNFPNTRSFEQDHGRVVELQAGETKTFRVDVCPLTTVEEVQMLKADLELRQPVSGAMVHREPKAGWSDV